VLGARIDLGDVGLQQTGLSPSEAYILFILPGLVVLGMISNAFENASFSIFHGRWNEYIHEVLTLAAVPHRDGTGLRHGVELRGVVVGLIIWGIGWLFAPVPLVNPFYLLRVHDRHPGAVRRLRSHRRALGGGFRLPDGDESVHHPAARLFGAVFYPLEALDGIALTVSYFNPMVYMVNGVRYGVVPGAVDVDPNTSLAVLTGLTVAVVALDVALVKRGYGLVE